MSDWFSNIMATLDGEGPAPAPAKAQNKTAGGAATPDPLKTVKPESLPQGDCLSRMLPPQGVYNMFTTGDKRNRWANSLEERAAIIESLGDRTDIYYAVASFKQAGAEFKGRTQDNVAQLKCFRLDLDAGAKKLETLGEAGAYETQAQALESVREFSERTGLEYSVIVSSGEGLHVYYELAEPVTPEEWRPVAKAFQKFGTAHGLKIDSSVTADTARVLRPIGTLHPNGKTVTVLEDTSKVYTLAEFAGIVGAATDGGEALASSGFSADDLAVNADIQRQHDDTPADFELVKKECAAVRFAADPANQPKVGEGYWRGLHGIVKFCTGADELAHAVSRAHPEYDPDLTEKKLAGWAAGPTTCDYFAEHNREACAGCKHRGAIKSPIVKGRVTNEAPKGEPGAAALTQALDSGALRTIVDQDGVLNYVETYPKNGRACRSVFAAGSQEATDLVLTTVTTTNGRAPSLQAIATAEARLRSKARRSGVTTTVHLRVAQVGEVRYHDLAPGRIIRVDAHGWSLVDESGDAPLFRRGAGAGELPDPERFTGGAREALAHCVKHYRDLFGTPTHRAILAVGVLLDRLDPQTPHPIFERVGPAGSGKTTLTWNDVNMIDPPAGDSLRTTGQRAEDIGAASQEQYALSMDNARHLDKTTSDLLCIASTGGTITARKFHEQTKTVSLNIHRPVYLTGVNPVGVEADLLTRIIREDCPPRDDGADVVGEEEMRELIRERRPAFLGALYTLKVASLRALPEVRQRKGWKHRMVTFDQTGEAMLTAAGYEAGAFQKIVGDLREAMARRNASGDVFLLKVCAALRKVQDWAKDAEEPALRQVLQRPRAAAVFDTAQGVCAVMRPSVLLALLPVPDPWDKNPAIPKTERALMDALRRVQPTCRQMGISCRETAYGTRQMLRFEWRPADLGDNGPTS